MKLKIEDIEYDVVFKTRLVTYVTLFEKGKSKRFYKSGGRIHKPYPDFQGAATCNPADKYSILKGKEIALKHAIQKLAKHIRREIWEQFNRITKTPFTNKLMKHEVETEIKSREALDLAEREYNVKSNPLGVSETPEIPKCDSGSEPI